MQALERVKATPPQVGLSHLHAARRQSPGRFGPAVASRLAVLDRRSCSSTT